MAKSPKPSEQPASADPVPPIVAADPPDDVKVALADMHGIAVEDVFGWNASTGTVVTVDGRKLVWPPA